MRQNQTTMKLDRLRKRKRKRENTQTYIEREIEREREGERERERDKRSLEFLFTWKTILKNTTTSYSSSYQTSTLLNKFQDCGTGIFLPEADLRKLRKTNWENCKKTIVIKKVLPSVQFSSAQI